MKSLRQLSLPVLAVAALATACNPFTPRNTPAATPTQYPEDPRFAEFVYKSDETPTVKDRTDSVNIRWPNAKTSEAHVVGRIWRRARHTSPSLIPAKQGSSPTRTPSSDSPLLPPSPTRRSISSRRVQPPILSCPVSTQACTGMCRRNASSPPLPRPSRTRRSHQIRRRFHTISAPWTYKR